MTISIGTVEQFPIQARIPWILPKQNNLKYILGTINAVLTYYFWNEGLEARLNHFSLDDGHNRRRNEAMNFKKSWNKTESYVNIDNNWRLGDIKEKL